MKIEFEFTAQFTLPYEKDLLDQFWKEVNNREPFVVTNTDRHGRFVFIKVKLNKAISDETKLRTRIKVRSNE